MSVANKLVNGAVQSPKQLFKDCLRMVEHIARGTAKCDNLKSAVRVEFRKHRSLIDQNEIQTQKTNAYRFMSNFLLIESNKKMQDMDPSKVSFNLIEKESQERAKVAKRHALKAQVLREAEEDPADIK